MGPHQGRHISLDAAGLSSALMAKQDLSRSRVNKKPGQAEPCIPLQRLIPAISCLTFIVFLKKRPRQKRQLEAERLWDGEGSQGLRS